MEPEIEPASSWILIRFVSTEPQWELPDVLFYIFMIILLLFLVFIIAFTNRFSFFFFCILAYLNDYFPVVISSTLYLVTSFLFRGELFFFFFRMDLILLYSFSFCSLEKLFISPILNDNSAG